MVSWGEQAVPRLAHHAPLPDGRQQLRQGECPAMHHRQPLFSHGPWNSLRALLPVVCCVVQWFMLKTPVIMSYAQAYFYSAYFNDRKPATNTPHAYTS